MVEDVEEIGEPGTEIARGGADHLVGHGIALLRGLIHRGGRDAGQIAAGHLGEDAGRAGLDLLHGAARNRGPGGIRLEATIVAAAAATPVEVDGDVADLARAIRRAMMQSTIEHDAAADAGADGHADDMTPAARRPDPRLAQHGAIGVVVERRHQAEALGELGAQRHVHPAEIGGEEHHAGVPIERARGADADAEDLRLGQLTTQLGHRVMPHLDQRGHDGIRAACGVGRSRMIADDARTIGGDGADHEIGAADVDAENPLHRVVSGGCGAVKGWRLASGSTGRAVPANYCIVDRQEPSRQRRGIESARMVHPGGREGGATGRIAQQGADRRRPGRSGRPGPRRALPPHPRRGDEGPPTTIIGTAALIASMIGIPNPSARER